jgi:hypothetical protein
MAGSTEVRVFAEGSLRFVAASAPNGGWITASAPASALVGFVQAGTQAPSAQTVLTIYDRGVPNHHKVTRKEAHEFTFTFQEAVTANDPALRVATAGGATVPLLHFELKSKAAEDGSAIYYQLHHCSLVSNNWTEGEDGNNRQQTWRALSYVGPTASGYLSTALA